MAANADPFPAAKEHVKGIVERCKSNFDKYQSIILNQDTSVNQEYKELRRVIAKDIRAAESALKLLKESVDKIDPIQMKKFNIKQEDLNERRNFVEKAGKVINKVKGGLDSEAVRKKLDSDQAKTKRNAHDDALQAMQQDLQRDNDRFINNQHTQQKQIIREQDQNLELLDQGLTRLQERSKAINAEIKEQDVLLDGLKKDVDDANDRILTVNEALQKLLGTKDGCQIWTVVILVGVLILLVALVIWT